MLLRAAKELKRLMQERRFPNRSRLKDAVFNLGRSSFAYCSAGNGQVRNIQMGYGRQAAPAYANKLFRDLIIFPGVRELPECLSVAISGSGPSVIALVNSPTPKKLPKQCARLFTEHGVRSQFFVLDSGAQGPQIAVDMGLKDAIERAWGNN